MYLIKYFKMLFFLFLLNLLFAYGATCNRFDNKCVTYCTYCCVCIDTFTDLYTRRSIGPQRHFFVFRCGYKHDGQGFSGGHEIILDLSVVGHYT